MVDESSGTASTTSVEGSPIFSSNKPSRSYIPLPRARSDWLADSFQRRSKTPPTPRPINIEEPLPLAVFHEDIDSALCYAYALVSIIVARQGPLRVQDKAGLVKHQNFPRQEMGNFDLLPEGKSTLLPSDSIGVSLANALAVLQTLPTFPEILFPLEGWDPELRQYGVHILRLAGKFAVLPGLHIPLVDGEPRGTRCHEGAFLWPALCEQALVALIGDKRLVRLSLTDDILRDLSDSYWVERMEVAGGNWQDRVNESVATENTVVLACTYMSDQDAQGVNDEQINFVEHIDQQRVALRCPFQESPESLVEIDLHTFSGAFNSIITLRNIPPSASRWTFRGRFTCDTCGGTPIPTRQPVPGGEEVDGIVILTTWLR